ncbi:MAG: RDD family protein [Saprospiraceae bacterium]|nr:RDD family protein [Saprospiraceae bacterium]
MTEDSLEFKTANNISISYPKAGLGTRMGAYLIDFAILYFVVMIIVIFSMGESISYLLSMIVFTSWHFLFEVFNKGQSPGKMAMKIKVVSLDGSSPSLKSLFIRWLFRVIDISMTLGSLAMISIHGSSLGQRLGDQLANTTVVKTKVKYMTDLKVLEKLNAISRNVTYSNLNIYDDELMSNIKALLERLQLWRTEENVAVFRKVYASLERDLHFKPETILDRQIAQVKTILEDYIITTR